MRSIYYLIFLIFFHIINTRNPTCNSPINDYDCLSFTSYYASICTNGIIMHCIHNYGQSLTQIPPPSKDYITKNIRHNNNNNDNNNDDNNNNSLTKIELINDDFSSGLYGWEYDGYPFNNENIITTYGNAMSLPYGSNTQMAQLILTSSFQTLRLSQLFSIPNKSSNRIGKKSDKNKGGDTNQLLLMIGVRYKYVSNSDFSFQPPITVPPYNSDHYIAVLISSPIKVISFLPIASTSLDELSKNNEWHYFNSSVVINKDDLGVINTINEYNLYFQIHVQGKSGMVLLVNDASAYYIWQ